MRTKFMLLVVMAVPILALAAGTGRDQTRSSTIESNQEPIVTRPTTPQAQATPAQAPNYNLDWVSINCGGETEAVGVSRRSGVSIGQTVAGEATSPSYRVGLGYWYGALGACPIVMTGDVNLNSSITSADIIYTVGYVFKGGPAPLPCEAAGDVNCNGSVTSADIIYLVGYVFKGGPPPCDVCDMIPGSWSCP